MFPSLARPQPTTRVIHWIKHKEQSVRHVRKLVNIASMVAKLGNMFRKQILCLGSKNFSDLGQKHFFFYSEAKFVSATCVSRGAKLGNISASATMFPYFSQALTNKKGYLLDKTQIGRSYL